MSGKYTPLEHYLRDLSASQRDVTLTFEQIERILNDKLPPSAFKHRPWWGNEKAGRHIPSFSWLNVGWKVDTVNLENEWVRFVRQ